MRPIMFLDKPSIALEDFYYLLPDCEYFSLKDIHYIYTHFKRPDYNRYPNAKIIICPCTGINHLRPIPPDIQVIHLDNKEWLFLNAHSTAEWTINAMFTLIRRNNEELNGKKIGLIGYGRVAQQVAAMLQGFKCEVFYMDYKEPEYYLSDMAEPIGFYNILSSCDIISVHLSESENNNNFIRAEHFKYMKDKYFINCSRSSVVDGLGIIDNLVNLKGVYLDVIEDYSNEVKMALLNAQTVYSNNLHITYHTAGKGVNSRIATDNYVLNKFIYYLDMEGLTREG